MHVPRFVNHWSCVSRRPNNAWRISFLTFFSNQTAQATPAPDFMLVIIFSWCQGLAWSEKEIVVAENKIDASIYRLKCESSTLVILASLDII